jgi:hypothetical protein
MPIKQTNVFALLPPIMPVTAPKYLHDDCNKWIRSALVAQNIKLSNLAEVSNAMKTLPLKMSVCDYVVLGCKLGVDYLLQIEVTDYEITAPSNRTDYGAYKGKLCAKMKIIDAAHGSVIDTLPIVWNWPSDGVAASQTTMKATDGGGTVTDTATVNVQVQVPFPKPPPPSETEGILPFRVCVMEFTTIDMQGKIRFIDPANKELDVAPRCTLNSADRTSVNDVMQGFVRLVDAIENHKTKDRKNDITRDDALNIWNTAVHGETRPAVIGAEYLESYLGRNGEIFACVDRPLMVAAMKKLQADPDFPSDFQLKLARATGATHIIYTTVGNITSRENSFSGYGIETKTTNYALDVIVKMVDLVTQQTVHANTYTGTYREQRPISGAQFDNNIFQSLMKSALQQAADEILSLCRPGRSCKIRVTPVHTGT